MAELAFHPVRPARKTDASDVDGHAASRCAKKTTALASARFNRGNAFFPSNILSMDVIAMGWDFEFDSHGSPVSQQFVSADFSIFIFEFWTDARNFLHRSFISVAARWTGTNSWFGKNSSGSRGRLAALGQNSFAVVRHGGGVVVRKLAVGLVESFAAANFRGATAGTIFGHRVGQLSRLENSSGRDSRAAPAEQLRLLRQKSGLEIHQHDCAKLFVAVEKNSTTRGQGGFRAGGGNRASFSAGGICRTFPEFPLRPPAVLNGVNFLTSAI